VGLGVPCVCGVCFSWPSAGGLLGSFWVFLGRVLLSSLFFSGGGGGGVCIWVWAGVSGGGWWLVFFGFCFSLFLRTRMWI